MKYAGRIILASASPRRRELLERAGVPFDVRVADVSEDADVSAPPERLAVSNAELKASRVARENAERLVLGADTVVYRNSKIYGKPRDIADAKRMLAELRGGAHSVFTGVCAAYFDGAELRTKTACGESRVHFKSLDADAISEYVSKVDVLDKAGAYAAICSELSPRICVSRTVAQSIAKNAFTFRIFSLRARPRRLKL